VATVLSPDLNVVPTLLLEHKAHLTENAFDRIVKEQVRCNSAAVAACSVQSTGQHAQHDIHHATAVMRQGKKLMQEPAATPATAISALDCAAWKKQRPGNCRSCMVRAGCAMLLLDASTLHPRRTA
jgi:hypothetical protein